MTCLDGRWKRCLVRWNTGCPQAPITKASKQSAERDGRKMPNHEQITIYIAVNSVNEYVKRVEELGGKVIKPKTEVLAQAGLHCAWTQRITFSLCGRLIRNKRTPSSFAYFLVYLYNLTLNFILGIVLAKSVKPPAKDASCRKRHITRQRKRKAAKSL